MFEVTQLAVGGLDDNFSYFICASNGDAAVVDPCGDTSKIIAEIRRHPDARPKYILITHGHRDHISGLADVLNVFPAPVAAHPECRVHSDIRLADHLHLPFGDSYIECLFTPGHAVSSVCYRLGDDSAIFTGDTLFIDCCGYCDPAVMFHTMREILYQLPDSLIVYSGHDYGHVPYEALGAQKKTNPYLYTKDLPAFIEEVKKL